MQKGSSRSKARESALERPDPKLPSLEYDFPDLMIQSPIVDRKHARLSQPVGRPMESNLFSKDFSANIFGDNGHQIITEDRKPSPVPKEVFKTAARYFQQFGKVIEANIVYNHETMRSRGFGFVIFNDEKTVTEVLKRYDDHYLYGKWVS